MYSRLLQLFSQTCEYHMESNINKKIESFLKKNFGGTEEWWGGERPQ